MSWKHSAARVRSELDAAIPEKWKLPPGTKQDDTNSVLKVPATCGLLSTEQLRITELDASALVSLLADRQLTSLQVTEAFCARAAIAHQLVSGAYAAMKVNCLTVFFPDMALAEARRLDEHIGKTGKTVGPLHGLPIAVKDTFDVLGYPTTWGYAANASHSAQRESAVIKILRDAGAIIFAKTTMPQAGMLLETVSNLYGRTLNPRNLDFGSGGSSGGDGALVALKGSPFCPSTDIGGSIRAPAAFNKLYAIRPTADRVPKRGMKSVEAGQLNIRVSCGPEAHSMADVRLMSRVLLSSQTSRYDPTCVPVQWREDTAYSSSLPSKLSFGYWEFDGVVMPQPPILRALRQVASDLRAAGHEIIPFIMPIDCWEASKTYMDIYYQCGNKDCHDLLASAGEVVMPAYRQMLDRYNVPDGPIDAKRLLDLIQKQSRYRESLADAWDATKTLTATGRPVDGLICPVSSVAGYPHDFLPWWGYTSLFNLVDYPSTVLPLKHIVINERDDAKDTSYVTQENIYDVECQDIYNAKKWANMPVAVQIVARPFDDEELIAVTEVVDKVVNNDI